MSAVRPAQQNHRLAAFPADEGAEETIQRRRVLVVDDNRDAAESVATLMRLMGHTVSTAYDGTAALAVAIKFIPEIVFVDLVMPGVDGFEVARKLRDLDPFNTIKLVALTGFGQQAFKDAADAAGFDFHLAKPASEAELRELLQL
jgi:CheY-like chemotaxis protein